MTRPFSVSLPGLFVLTVLLVPMILPATMTPQNPNHSHSIQDQIRQKASALDTAKAISLAEHSQQFLTNTQGLPFRHTSTLNTWNYTTNLDGSVTVNWRDVELVYQLQNSDGSRAELVVSEKPDLTNVLSVTIIGSIPDSLLRSYSRAASPSQQSFPGAMTPQMLAPLVPSVNSATSIASSQPTSSPSSVTAGPLTGPDFSISASPTSVAFAAGGSNSSKITLTSLNGFVGSIALITTISSSPGPPSATLNVTSITLLSGGSGSTTLSINSTRFTNAQNYTITVTAVSGTIRHSATVAASITPNVQISATTPASFTAGDTASSTVSLASTGFSGSSTLSASVSPTDPNDPTFSFSPNPVSLTPGLTSTSTMTITTTDSTPSNAYTVIITSNSSKIIRTTSITITVLADFEISASSPAHIGAGTSGISTISIYSRGLSNSVFLSASTQTSGITMSFSTNPVPTTPGTTTTSTMTISVNGNVPTGNYTVTVTGTSGSITHSTTATINVCDIGMADLTQSAGYSFRGACRFSTATVYDAKATWFMPGVSAPPNTTCDSSSHCDLNVLVGLTHSELGSDGFFVIAGTDSRVNNGVPYIAVMELAPNAPQVCDTTKMVITPGDQITSEVLNEGAGSNNLYDLFVTDNTTKIVCSLTAQSTSMGRPTGATFFGGTPTFNGVAAHLPSFGAVTLSQCFIASAAASTCLGAYSQGYASQYTMLNTGTTVNIAVSAVGSDDSFTLTYQSSAGT